MMMRMSIPLPQIWHRDGSPTEIESREELNDHLSAGSLAGRTIQGLSLDVDPPNLTSVDVRDALFVGCRFPDAAYAAALVRRGASVVPIFEETPYPTTPSRLYVPDDLAAGFDQGGYKSIYDTVVYQHFLAHGGALPDVREALAQRIHDAGIDNALVDATRGWVSGHGAASIVGVMGGHAEPRGSRAYRLAADLSHRLAGAGRLLVTGGGPGVMEATNLGAYLGHRPASDLTAAVDRLSVAPDFTDHDPYTAAALAVRRTYPAPAADLTHGGLAIPTWLYGHEPANLFAARIAKYFSNAIREDTVLRLARGGVVFAPGRAGTLQEVFQAATKAFYRSDGPSGPLVFLDATFWTSTIPVQALLRPLLATSPHGDLAGLIHVTDDVSDAMAVLTSG
jgi:predicted Rossmann-fold nucleotide-binding protein